jgi:hypothetical protein
MEHYCSRIPLLLRLLGCHQVHPGLNLAQPSQVLSFLYFSIDSRNHSDMHLRILFPSPSFDVRRTGCYLHTNKVWKWHLHGNSFLVTYARRLRPVDGPD